MSATVVLYNSLGALAGISAGLAIPALAAFSAGSAMRQFRCERLREMVKVLNGSLRLARRGVMAISHDGSANLYFQNEYHWSYIERALQWVERIERDGQAEYVDHTVTAAQRELREIFTLVHLAASLHRDAQSMAAADIDRLNTLYDEFHDHVAYLENVCASMETTPQFCLRLDSVRIGRFSKSALESVRKSTHHKIHAN